MKKLVLIFLIGACMKANAQHVSFGFKAGANISNFINEPIANASSNSLVGFYGGAYLNFGIVSGLSLQPEALISTQGVKIQSSTATGDFKLTYINVPVMLKYRTTSGFYLEAGPQVGFKIDESIPDQTIQTFAKELDLSVGAGLGFQSKKGLGIGARYLAGLSKVGDFNSSAGLNPDFKNSVIQIGITFSL